MKKLVIKSQLSDRAEFERRVTGIGLKFSSTIWQHERIYVPSDYRPNMNHPRMVLRTEVKQTDQPANYTMFLKRHIEDSGIDVVHATAVGDYTEATAMIHQLGFRKAAEVSRQRQELTLDERTAMYLDVVEGLAGSFLKIEAELTEGAAVETLRREIFRTLDLFGQGTFIMQTYADLMTDQMQPYYLPEY